MDWAGTGRTRAVRPRPPSSVDGLTMVGWSHHGSSLALLEQVRPSHDVRPRLLAALQAAGFPEPVLLSTCSRTEVYAAGPGPGSDVLVATVAQLTGAPRRQLAAAAELRRGRAVVEHLFLVAAGLRSRVVGEGEVRAQVRGAARAALTCGVALPTSGPLFAAAARSASRVGDVTGLGARARSLARRAVEVGMSGVADVEDPVVLVVGAGHMARTAVEHLHALGLHARVAARRELQAVRLAGAGSTCPLPALARGIAAADVLLCATSASSAVVTVEHVREAMASGRRPLTVVDLSVPRNVDADVARVPGVRLVDVEGLGDDLAADRELATALATGRALARQEAERYVEDVASRGAGPLIAALRGSVEELCLRELTRAAASDVDREVLVRAARALTGKLMHAPTVTARAAAARGDEAVLGLLAGLFDVPVRSAS